MNVELRDEARDDLVTGAVFYGERIGNRSTLRLICTGPFAMASF